MFTTHCLITSAICGGGIRKHYVYGPLGYLVPKGRRKNLGKYDTREEAEKFKNEWEKAHHELWENEHIEGVFEGESTAFSQENTSGKRIQKRARGTGSIRQKGKTFEAWSPGNKYGEGKKVYLGAYKSEDAAQSAINRWIESHTSPHPSTNDIAEEIEEYLKERALSGDRKALELLIGKRKSLLGKESEQ